MKKSDLKKALLKFTVQRSKGFYSGLTSEEAESIMDLIESLGMEPPRVKRKVTLEKRVDPNNIFSYVEYVNEWENET